MMSYYLIIKLSIAATVIGVMIQKVHNHDILGDLDKVSKLLGPHQGIFAPEERPRRPQPPPGMKKKCREDPNCVSLKKNYRKKLKEYKKKLQAEKINLQRIQETVEASKTDNITIAEENAKSGCKCGAPIGQSQKRKVSDWFRIVGGREASVGEFPWLFGLRSLFDTRGVFCGASLINDLYVVTARHCVNHRKFFVVVGNVFDLNNQTSGPDGGEKTYKVKDVIKYLPDGSMTDAILPEDLALLRLESPIKFTSSIYPICLPLPSNMLCPTLPFFPTFCMLFQDDYMETKMTTAGWGALSFGGKSSNKLMKVTMDVVPHWMCGLMFGVPVFFPFFYLCAGDTIHGYKDACQGDSGGPLMTLKNVNNEQRYELAGVVSWGIGCGERQFPGVYMRVSLSRYYSWIEKNIQEGVHDPVNWCR